MLESIKVNGGGIVGVDVGDRASLICRMDRESGKILEETRLSITTTSVQQYFAALEPQSGGP